MVFVFLCVRLVCCLPLQVVLIIDLLSNNPVASL